MLVLAVSSNSNFASVHKAIGVLSQLMILVTYAVYFGLDDFVADLTEAQDENGLLTIQVLAGVSKSGLGRLGNDGGSILIALVPLFVTLVLCFL